MVLLGVGPRCAVRWAPPSGTGTTGPLGERLHGGNLLPCLRLGAFLQSACQSAGVPGSLAMRPGREPDADPGESPTRTRERARRGPCQTRSNPPVGEAVGFILCFRGCVRLPLSPPVAPSRCWVAPFISYLLRVPQRRASMLCNDAVTAAAAAAPPSLRAPPGCSRAAPGLSLGAPAAHLVFPLCKCPCKCMSQNVSLRSDSNHRQLGSLVHLFSHTHISQDPP